MPFAQVVLECLTERLLPNLPHPKRLCYGREEPFCLCQSSKRHQKSAVWEVIQEIRCCLQGEPCLADPAWSCEGEQARLLAAQEVAPRICPSRARPEEWAGGGGCCGKRPASSRAGTQKAVQGQGAGTPSLA